MRRWGIVLGGLLAAGPARAIDIDKCDATAKAEIQRVYDALTPRLNAIVARFTWLTDKQRDELKDKWAKMKVDCEDDRNKCAKDDLKDGQIITGYAHGGLGNTVNVCYYNLVESNGKLCTLAETLWHEKGHADGMPKDNHHNHPDKHPEALNDDVYRMGFSAGDECRASVFVGAADRLLNGHSQLALGATCGKDDQCKSDKCGRDGKCVCKRNDDCPGDQKCKEPIGGIAHCE